MIENGYRVNSVGKKVMGHFRTLIQILIRSITTFSTKKSITKNKPSERNTCHFWMNMRYPTKIDFCLIGYHDTPSGLVIFNPNSAIVISSLQDLTIGPSD